MTHLAPQFQAYICIDRISIGLLKMDLYIIGLKQYYRIDLESIIIKKKSDFLFILVDI